MMEGTIYVPDDFYCPITGELMTDPVSERKGFTYERDAIIRWLATNPTSPMSREPLMKQDLLVNHSMRKSIESIRGKLSEDQLRTRSRITHEEMKPFTEPLQDIEVTTYMKDGGILVSIHPPNVGVRAPVDLILCIDVSGSMGSEATLKGDDGSQVRHGISILSLTVSAAKTILQSLNEKDNLSIVTYTDKAYCIVDTMACTPESKSLIETQLDQLVPLNCTNLWEGIHASLEIIRKNSPAERTRGIFVLTDGVPNMEPPRGHEYMLEKYLKQNDMKCMINCYGFGYSLKSDLLDSISTISGGDGYSFIPDASLLGNVFIHGLSNFFTSIQNVSLRIELPGETQLLDVHSLKYGQEKNIFLDLQNPATTQVGVRVTLVLSDRDIECNGYQEPDESYYNGQICRKRVQDSLEEWIQMKKFNTGDVKNNVEQLISYVRSLPETVYIQNILHDLEGQIKEALNMTSQGGREDWFSRWGIHYLRSLRRAYCNEICNNFKDKGVSNFGGDLFNTIRDEVSDIFDSLPPPKSMNVTGGGGGMRGGGMTSSPPPSMASYNNASGGCCARGCRIQMADHTYKPVEQLVKGDKIVSVKVNMNKSNCIYYTTSEIECVIETLCDRGKESMVTLDTLKITPYHPVMNDTYEWRFPKSLGKVEEISCQSMFTFITQDRGCVIIEAHIFATYGHYISGDVISHDYFGTNKVISDMKVFETYDRGYICLTKECFKRGKNGRIRNIQEDPVMVFHLANM